MLVHLVMMLIPQFKHNLYRSKFKRNWNFVVNKTRQIFSFAIYLRLIMEAYQHLLLASFSQLSYTGIFEDLPKIVSTATAITVIVLCVLFLSMAIGYYCLNRKGFPKNERYYLGEFFEGLKDSKYARLIPILVLARRMAFVILLLMASTDKVLPSLAPMALIQLFYLIVIILTRPMDDVSDNLIEMVNEFFYLFFVSWQLYFNKEERWSSSRSYVYVGSMIFNTIIVCCISLGNVLFNIHIDKIFVNLQN